LKSSQSLKEIEKGLSAVCDLSSHSCERSQPRELGPISKCSKAKNNYLFKDISKLAKDLFRKALECWNTEKQNRMMLNSWRATSFNKQNDNISE
jgi:hypothetical protein